MSEYLAAQLHNSIIDQKEYGNFISYLHNFFIFEANDNIEEAMRNGFLELDR